MEGYIIRKYEKKDRNCVRDIAWNTAFRGEPASAFFSDKEILADFLTLYFTDYEPESCFVAEAKGRVIGYLIGAKDTAILNQILQLKIVPRLLIKGIINCTFLKKKNLIFFFQCLLSFLKGEFRMPCFYSSYPATLHINLEPGFRRKGVGSRLIAAYLTYLNKEGMVGVNLATISEEGSWFFKARGFNLLHQGRRSYFRYILYKDIPLYIFGKQPS